jgi:hypothetical protein
MANEHVGARQEIAFKVEAQRGTKVDPTTSDWYPHTGQGFLPVVELVTDNSGMGRIEGVLTENIAKQYSQGTVTMRLYDSFLTPLNRMIFGAAGTGTPTVYTVDNTNTHNSFTIATADPVEGDNTYAMGMLNTCTITCNTDDYVNLSMEFIAKKETAGALTPSYSATAKMFTPDNVTFGYAANYAGLSSATAMVVKNFQLNIEKNVVTNFSLGSTEPTNIENGRLSITGDITLKYNSTTYHDFALSDTAKAFKLTLNNGAFTWTLAFPSVVFKGWNRTTDLDGIVEETFGFTANYADKTNGLVIGTVTAA